MLGPVGSKELAAFTIVLLSSFGEDGVLPAVGLAAWGSCKAEAGPVVL